MKKQRGFTIVELLMVIAMVVILVGAVGWIKNVIKLTECDFEAPYKAEVVHGLGIIPPVGMVTGWLNLGV